MHGPVLGLVGLGGEGLVHAFLEPECGQEPGPAQAKWQAEKGPGSAQAFEPLLCAPSGGDHRDWEVQAGLGRTVKSRGTWRRWKAIPPRGCRARGGWVPLGLCKGKKVLEDRVEWICECP